MGSYEGTCVMCLNVNVDLNSHILTDNRIQQIHLDLQKEEN